MVITLSGIFRDLLPLQTKLLAEAALLAASADEPVEQNFVRKHALAYQAQHGGDLEDAALRVFGNADGAYGANVNHLVDSGRWDDEDELAEAYRAPQVLRLRRSGQPRRGRMRCCAHVLASVDLAYQNLDSVELGVTTVDHYFDTLGGISRAVKRARGDAAPVYIGDQTRGDGTVRTLAEQVALETRTRMLNPKWYEALLKHGYEGVRADRGARDQHDGLVRDHRPGGAVGLPAAHRNLRARSRDARAAGRAQSDRVGEGREPTARGARAQLLVARRRRCWMRCGAPAKSWKTASKASAWRVAA